MNRVELRKKIGYDIACVRDLEPEGRGDMNLHFADDSHLLLTNVEGSSYFKLVSLNHVEIAESGPDEFSFKDREKTYHFEFLDDRALRKSAFRRLTRNARNYVKGVVSVFIAIDIVLARGIFAVVYPLVLVKMFLEYIHETLIEMAERPFSDDPYKRKSEDDKDSK